MDTQPHEGPTRSQPRESRVAHGKTVTLLNKKNLLKTGGGGKKGKGKFRGSLKLRSKGSSQGGGGLEGHAAGRRKDCMGGGRGSLRVLLGMRDRESEKRCASIQPAAKTRGRACIDDAFADTGAEYGKNRRREKESLLEGAESAKNLSCVSAHAARTGVYLASTSGSRLDVKSDFFGLKKGWEEGIGKNQVGRGAVQTAKICSRGKKEVKIFPRRTAHGGTGQAKSRQSRRGKVGGKPGGLSSSEEGKKKGGAEQQGGKKPSESPMGLDRAIGKNRIGSSKSRACEKKTRRKDRVLGGGETEPAIGENGRT